MQGKFQVKAASVIGNDAAWDGRGGGRRRAGGSSRRGDQMRRTRSGGLGGLGGGGRVRRLSKQVVGSDNNPGCSVAHWPWVSARSPAAIQQRSSNATVVLRKLGPAHTQPTTLSRGCEAPPGQILPTLN
ncbi:unnamed protein product [Pleuronectes platessa]|uniref:Uncharacterized protein n=1 Tax=Pleuronectes platessa TaxID=8262 RepID=A0A9N7UZS3_PLEPL|nr:unnamed protein product [Pleuronectes platessa]